LVEQIQDAQEVAVHVQQQDCSDSAILIWLGVYMLRAEWVPHSKIKQ